MQKFWTDASNTPLYKDWIGGVATGLLAKGGLYDSSPLKKFLTNEFATVSALSRDVNVGLVNILTGKWADFQKEQLVGSTLTDVMYASLSKPPFFAPVESSSSFFYDGSAIWDIDIPSAVNRCLARVSSPADVVLDVIMTQEKELAPVDTTDFNSLEMGFRFFRIANYYGTMDGLLRA